MDSGMNESVFSEHFFDLNPICTRNGPWISMQMGEQKAIEGAKHTLVMKQKEGKAKQEL